MAESTPTQAKLLVFLSHASEDKPRVRKLCKRLRDDGFDPWLDEERLMPGQDWKLEIQQAMRASQAILLCFSRLSVAKEGYVQREYKKAMDLQLEKPEGAIFVIPVRLDVCEAPSSIRELHYVDYPAGYNRLAQALNQRAEAVNAVQAQPKAEKKTNPAPRVRRSEAPPGGPIFNIQGGIHIGGDFVGRDQINSISNTTINNISSPAEFVGELQKLKAEIVALKFRPGLEPAAARRLSTVEGDLQDAIEESEQQRPAAKRIYTTLEDAKEALDKLGGGITSAANLGTALGNLALMAWKVFGG